MRNKSFILFVSFACFLISIILIIFLGLHWGIDFTGGSVIQINCNKNIELNKIKESLNNINNKKLKIHYFKNKNNVAVMIPSELTLENNFYIKKILYNLKNNKNINTKVRTYEYIVLNKEKNFIKKVYAAIITILHIIYVYIKYRFSFILSITIIMSLIYNLVIMLGLISIFKIYIDILVFIFLFFLIIYFFNLSIIFLNKIKENIKEQKENLKNTNDYDKIIKLSVNQTINTSALIFLIILIITSILLFFGGIITQDVFFTVLIGLFTGIFSSIYIYSYILLYYFSIKKSNFKKFIN